MTNLVTKNRGAICAVKNFPEIKSITRNNNTEAEPVSQINYVRECMKHDVLIDLTNFDEDFGMNKENDLFLLVDSHLRLQVEHSYARKDHFQRQSKNTSGEENDLCQTVPEITNGKSPTIGPMEITIIRRWVGGPRNGSFTAKQNSPKLGAKELNLPLGVKKESENSQQQISQEIDKSFDRLENMPLYKRLQGGQSSPIIISDDDMSPKISSKKFRREARARRRAIDDQLVARRSRTAESPTILRDEFDQVKILGNPQASRLTSPHRTSHETEESFDRIETMPLYERLQGGRSAPIIISDDDMSPRISSGKFRRKSHANQRVIDDQPVACSSRTAESTTTLRDKLNHVKILDNNRASRLTSSNSENSGASFARIDSTSPANNDASTSDKCFSNSESEDESRPSKSKRPSSWIERRNVNREEGKGGRVISRNFARWEQCEMVNYLIENRCISNAKGNLVWQKMLEDGFLKHRTYQSLNNNFRKYLLPNIHRFPMSSKCLKKFQKLQ